jgi:hypothetical protein
MPQTNPTHHGLGLFLDVEGRDIDLLVLVGVRAVQDTAARDRC